MPGARTTIGLHTHPQLSYNYPITPMPTIGLDSCNSPYAFREATMTTKKAAPTDDELLAQFEDLSTNSSSAPPSKSSKPPTARAPPKQPATAEADADLFADISKVQSQRPSRPSTPSVRASGTPKRSTATPPPGGRSSEEKSATATTGARKSGESTRSLHQALTPATTDDSPEPEPKPAASSGGGWWGGLLSTATAAVSQAQAAVKEIQKNEEAQRWASQVRGNVGALRGFGKPSSHPT